MEKKEILKKLHKVMSAISYIQKDKVNEFHRYAYASEEVIKKALHKEFVDQGILLFVNILNERRDIIQVSSKTGTRETGITTMNVGYEFVDIETGQSISGTFVGSGEDSGDKGLYKAITGAIKYILTTTFLIPTGNDPEVADDKTPTVNYGDAPVKKKWTPKTAPVDKFLHIKSQLKELGHDPRTMKLADELVFGLTGLNITDENINEIEG